ncbi:MAG: DNA recombination protein RmuC [Treponema sp.]|nr:DNA recombination protein RmuC [Treponema sp.]
MNITLSYIIIASVIVFCLILVILLVRSLAFRSSSPLSEIQQKLGLLEASAARIQEMGKEISSLNSLLHSPKLRGNFGEYLLYNLLKDTLPPQNFTIQHHFSDGSAVDAVIRLGKNIIPVDSKFPLESFERYLNSKDSESAKKAKTEFSRSVKGRIDEISKKYIRPEEGTFDFALMYIPSESVYYEILTNDTKKNWELFEYSMKNRVIPVSPNTFYAYLMSVVYGLKGMKIEEQAENIIKKVNGLQKKFADFSEDLSVLGRHISNTGAKFTEISEKAGKINNLLDNLSE